MGSGWRVLAVAVIISLGGGFQYGYQLTVINPSEISFKKFINSSYESHYGTYLKENQIIYLWAGLVNVQSLGGLLGSFFIKCLLDKLGRKRSFFVTNILFVISCILQGISKSLHAWEILLLGRFLCGVGQGTDMGLQSVYFSEISKKSARGAVGSMTGFMVEMGFLLASIVALPILLGSESRWPYLYLIQAVPSVLALMALPFFPESPKYLASKGDFGACGQALRWLGRSEIELKEEMSEIRQELSRDQSQSASISLRQLFTTAHIRKGVFLGWMVVFSAGYSGIMALSYFSTGILKDGGLSEVNAQYGTIGLTALCAVGAFVGTLIMDKLGRRKIEIGSNIILLLMNVLFIIFAHLTRVYSIQWTSYANMAVAAVITFVYGMGPALIIWILTAELVPQRARSLAGSLTCHVFWLCIFSAGLIFYPLQKIIKEFCFLIHILPLLLSILFFLLALPETKNRSILEIMRHLGYKGNEQDRQKTPLKEPVDEASL